MLLIGEDRPGDVPLRHMGDFMRQHRRQFAFVGGGKQQAGVYGDIATGQRECIDGRIVDHEEVKAVAGILGMGDEFLPDVLDVFLHFRIRDDPAGVTQALEYGAADLHLRVPGEHRVGRAADIGQVLRTCIRGPYDQTGGARQCDDATKNRGGESPRGAADGWRREHGRQAGERGSAAHRAFTASNTSST